MRSFRAQLRDNPLSVPRRPRTPGQAQLPVYEPNRQAWVSTFRPRAALRPGQVRHAEPQHRKERRSSSVIACTGDPGNIAGLGSPFFHQLSMFGFSLRSTPSRPAPAFNPVIEAWLETLPLPPTAPSSRDLRQWRLGDYHGLGRSVFATCIILRAVSSTIALIVTMLVASIVAGSPGPYYRLDSLVATLVVVWAFSFRSACRRRGLFSDFHRRSVPSFSFGTPQSSSQHSCSGMVSHPAFTCGLMASSSLAWPLQRASCWRLSSMASTPTGLSTRQRGR